MCLLRPAVLRFIPEPPGSFRFMDRDEPGENDVFLPKNLDGRPSRPSRPGSTPGHPGAPRFIQVEPRQGHGSSRRLHGSPRFSGRFTQVHAGRTPVTLRFFPVLHGGATVLPGSPRFIPSRSITVALRFNSRYSPVHLCPWTGVNRGVPGAQWDCGIRFNCFQEINVGHIGPIWAQHRTYV